ncbi:hypothetical protein [Burkholderia gladioli]|uniref:hypothetical protein n=1 Tax=Burkholderia gladioli TaxID=28095 RepID=UPI00163FD4AF|nr:hypothetical protein [Burkholderia gladioli]MDD1789129.1 hypothetical protein [Burkholderia gladioli]
MDDSICASYNTAGKGEIMFDDLLPIPKNLSSGFTNVFSRFEFALKDSGFATGGLGRVEPNWDAFALNIADKFDDLRDTRFREAVIYLVTSPPRKQALNHGMIVWRDSPPDARLRASVQALLMVRRVRNNLFHGAKVWLPDGDWGRERNEKLVKDSLAVLLACLPLNPYVGMSFGYYFDKDDPLSKLVA